MSSKISDIDNIVGMRIRELRKSIGLNGVLFSEKIGISQGHLSDIENGKVKIGKTLLLAISYVYNANYAWLKTGKGTPQKDDLVRHSGKDDESSRNIIDLQHKTTIREFKDKKFALEINKALVKLEQASTKEFYRIGGYIQANAEKHADYRTDCRQASEKHDGPDRRSGNDRRKVSGD